MDFAVCSDVVRHFSLGQRVKIPTASKSALFGLMPKNEFVNSPGRLSFTLVDFS